MKKGFTLVELVAVVSLLGLLLMFTYTKITDISEKKQKELLENKKTLVINAVKEYIDNNDEMVGNVGDIYCISIEELEDDNLVPVEIDDLKKKYNFIKVMFGSKNSYTFVKSADKETCETN